MTTATTLPVHSPYSGRLIGEVPLSSPEQVGELLAAGAAYKNELSRHERSQVLFAVADELAQRRNELATLITSESGLSLKDTDHEIGRGIDVFRFAAIEALRDDGEVFAGDISEQGRDRRAHTCGCRCGSSVPSHLLTTRSTRWRTNSLPRSPPGHRSC